MKQYNPKPHKWGFKVITRAGVSGLIYDFFIYTGKDDALRDTNNNVPTSCILRRTDTLPAHNNFFLYFDNWFSSPELTVKLLNRGIHSVATLRSNRLRGCPLKSPKELKASGRGSFDYRVSTTHNIAVVCWYDNSPVQLVSSYVACKPVTTVSRFSRQEKRIVNIQCPAIVKEYNSFMGGVDLSDMTNELYRYER
jgi:hypothetical protein